jgi:sialic acid synthase SpsE
LGKSLVASHTILKGKILCLNDIDVKVSRPTGIKPENIFNIIGKTVIERIDSDAPITQQAIDFVLNVQNDAAHIVK